jgi:hypothetical protein
MPSSDPPSCAATSKLKGPSIHRGNIAAATRSPSFTRLTRADFDDLAGAVGAHHHVRLDRQWIIAREDGQLAKVERVRVNSDQDLLPPSLRFVVFSDHEAGQTCT